MHRLVPSPLGFGSEFLARLTSGLQAGAKGYRPRVTWAQVGLIALVGLTTWAVASVSLWWVPAYLALMVLIFVTPRGQHPRVVSPTQGVRNRSVPVSPDWAKICVWIV